MLDPDPRRWGLRAVLSLPDPILRALTGGGATYVGGRTLDPQLQFLASQARGAAPVPHATPEQVRAACAAASAAFAGRLEPGVRVEMLTVPGAGDRRVAARTYRHPAQDPTAPLMLFAHGGGGVIGDLDGCEAFCGILCAVAGCAVLSVDYALAPEYRYPAGLEDMLSVYRWSLDQAPRFGAPAGSVAVGGESIGAAFAAAIAQETRGDGGATPRLQLLICPALDIASASPSMTTYADAFPLSRAAHQAFMAHYMGPGDSPLDPRLSPGLCRDLSGLAPALVVTAGFDPLLDQGEAYAKALRAAGVPTRYRCYDHLVHGFTAFAGLVPSADRACREIAGLARFALRSRGA